MGVPLRTDHLTSEVYVPTARPPAAAVFSCAGEALRRRGGPPRKAGPRHSNGHRKWEPSIDRGHEMTLVHRGRIVGEADAGDPKAGYPLGQLLLVGAIDERQHSAGLDYAADHFAVFGTGTPKSHLKSLISGMRLSSSVASSDGRDTHVVELRLGKKIADVRLKAGPPAFHVLHDVAVKEERPVGEHELELLRRALSALCGPAVSRETPSAAQPRNHSATAFETAAQPRRIARPRMAPVFVRDRDGPEDEAVAASVAKLKAARIGSA